MRTLVYDKLLGSIAVIMLILLCGAPIIAIIAATFGGISPLELVFTYLLVILQRSVLRLDGAALLL